MVVLVLSLLCERAGDGSSCLFFRRFFQDSSFVGSRGLVNDPPPASRRACQEFALALMRKLTVEEEEEPEPPALAGELEEEEEEREEECDRADEVPAPSCPRVPLPCTLPCSSLEAP